MLQLSKIFYNIALKLYYFVIWIASPFNAKAHQWLNGRKKINYPKRNILQKSIWIHAASLGEYEQARPVIDELRFLYPDKPIVITFFSPSGYNAIKNKNNNFEIYYLPLDSPKNAAFIVDYINPELTIFVKYEFWHYTLQQLKSRQITTLLISAIFRKEQLFFKSYGLFFKNMLHCFSYIFTQDKLSLQLLKSTAINNTSFAGDTRFDRVKKIADDKKDFFLIDEFKNSHKIFIAGSTWKKDEELLVAWINEHYEKLPDYKFIIAPHEINLGQIEKLQQTIKPTNICYSNLSEEDAAHYKVLIIDNIGMLSKLYRYADIAYIGGGFNKGIHNILEAAIHGLPVAIGTKFQKFKEAKDLVETKTAFSITNVDDFNTFFKKFQLNETNKVQCAKNLKQYFEENIGASQKIMSFIKRRLA